MDAATLYDRVRTEMVSTACVSSWVGAAASKQDEWPEVVFQRLNVLSVCPIANFHFPDVSWYPNIIFYSKLYIFKPGVTGSFE